MGKDGLGNEKAGSLPRIVSKYSGSKQFNDGGLKVTTRYKVKTKAGVGIH